VLRVEFINHSQQLLSTASDGLLKLWNVRQEDCTASMDNHEDKVRLFSFIRIPTLSLTWSLDLGLDGQ
jgi:WD40 repeat protein